jgi:hypothetical protein
LEEAVTVISPQLDPQSSTVGRGSPSICAKSHPIKGTVVSNDEK